MFSSFPRRREFRRAGHLNWIPACAPQGHSDLLSAEALAKSYAGMTGVVLAGICINAYLLK